MRPAVHRNVEQFLKSTTLHGFKYLSSPFRIDRLWWMFCGCASACCAGVLCAVFLARFMQVPPLLALLDSRVSPKFPVLAVCPSTPRLAQLFERKMLDKNTSYEVDLPSMFYSLLRSKALTPIQVDFLEQVLAKHNMTLAEALANVTNRCDVILQVCRWRNRILPCEQLFYKEITEWGICCMTKPDIFGDDDNVDEHDTMPLSLDLIIQFSEKSVLNGCEFYTRYEGEEAVLPIALTQGYYYRAQLAYLEIKDSSKEKLIDIDCVSANDYSAEICKIKCKEQQCKCSDPLTPLTNDDEYPDCTVRQMNCLKSLDLDALSCHCLPSCRKIFTQTILEANPINELELENTFDPIFGYVNATSAVFSLIIRNTNSKIYDQTYNDTWWSLLSSLGGVFNMFLGVGFISVLELLSFLLVRLPLACCRATQIRVRK